MLWDCLFGFLYILGIRVRGLRDILVLHDRVKLRVIALGQLFINVLIYLQKKERNLRYIWKQIWRTSGEQWDPTRCRPIEKECNDHTLLDTANFGSLVRGYVFLRRPRISWLLCDCVGFLIPPLLDIFPFFRFHVI